ncbi:hypothetical protein ASE92_00635 [Pedobacter sp. Leaf41]|uniref:hypothetical protein n=1 Tax=Pedobacter sp. Leaf41 TaxID=1736218 RepID=UPI0007036882|nr:hypothetical protein [Pedobacter sp. Leaf41]KQN37987.1 hypothetical protein ASE92_00635 [Pedobacter sp. Leaf41]
MKTSNKLLIALALLLIIVPILVIAINVKFNYLPEDKIIKNYESLDKFDAVTPYFKLRKLDKTFEKVNVTASKSTILKITLVESPQNGLKISENESENLIAVVDANGVLQISSKASKDKKMDFLSLVIFAPVIKQLSVTKALQLEINAKIKKLDLNVNNLQSMLFHPNTKIGRLNVSGNHVLNFSQSNNYVDDLNLNLDNSEFRASGTSYKVLTIAIKGYSHIAIEGDKSNRNRYKIDSLSITTQGKSSVVLTDMLVNKAHGDFSDSTAINASAKNLKLLMKN